MVDDKPYFGKSLFGFRRKDVINYISESSQEAKKKQAALTKQIETLLDENEKLKAELDSVKKETGDKKTELDSKASELEQVLAMETTLKNDIRNRDAEIENLRRQLAEAQARNEQLERDVAESAEHIDEMKRNADNFEDDKRRFADAQIEVRAIAERTLSDAQMKAEKMIAEAEAREKDISIRCRQTMEHYYQSLRECNKSVLDTVHGATEYLDAASRRLGDVKSVAEMTEKQVKALIGECGTDETVRMEE